MGIGEAPPSKPVLEIQPEPSNIPLSSFTFDSVQMISGEPGKEFVGLCFDSYANVAVANMLKKMNYFPGLGLGRNQQGLSKFPTYLTATPPFGLGYVPTEEDIEDQKVKARERALTWAQGRTFEWSMCLYFKTLNGCFVKQGDHFPYFQFPEPWMHMSTRKLMSGFEIFLDVRHDLEEDEPVKPSDWEDNMEASLFEQVSMIEIKVESDPTKLIQSSRVPLNNWHLEGKPNSNHLVKPKTQFQPESSLKKESKTVILSESIVVLVSPPESFRVV